MITTALVRMEDLLAEWERREDRRAVFLDCYARMTRAMCGSLEEGSFHDPEDRSRGFDRRARRCARRGRFILVSA